MTTTIHPSLRARKALLAAALLPCALNASAALLALESRLGGEAFYDPNLNITWARNADLLGETTLAAAIDGVNNLAIGGISNWRLPRADRNGDGIAVGCKAAGSFDACLDNELGFMLNHRDTSWANPGPFLNLRQDHYWTTDADPFLPPRVYSWFMGHHEQEGLGSAHPANTGLRTWAVHDGDVGTLTPAPGSTAANPLLPNTSTGGVFSFQFVAGTQRVFIDPDVAIGYDFVVHDGPNIADVLLPALAGDDGLFELFGFNAASGAFDLFLGAATAGTPFDFGTAGIDRFRVQGIDVAAGLDPADPQAFVTGLTFVTSGAVELDQIPLVQSVVATVPEPSSLALCLGALALFMRRRKARAALAALAGAAMVAAPAQAIVVAWDNPAGGAWDLPTNWAPTGVPNAGDDVVIATTTGGSTVQVLTNRSLGQTSISARSVTVSAPDAQIVMTNTELALSGAFEMSAGRLNMSSFSGGQSYLHADGGISLSGGAQLTTIGARLGGDISNSATMDLRNGMFFDGSGATGTFRNSGTVYVGTSGRLSRISHETRNSGRFIVTPGQADVNGFTNLAGGLVQIQGGRLELTHRDFVNRGVVEMSGANSIIQPLGGFTGRLINESGGVIDLKPLTSGQHRIYTTLHNAGLVEVGANLELHRFDAGHENSGRIHLANAATAVIRGQSFTNTTSGVIDGNGTLDLRGLLSFIDHGTLSPGNSFGRIDILGNYLQAADGILELQIGAGGQDQVFVTSGTATFNGTLRLNFVDGFAPGEGNLFELITGSVVANFASIELIGLAPGFEFELTGNDAGLRLLALNDAQAAGSNDGSGTSVPEPGSLWLLLAALAGIASTLRLRAAAPRPSRSPEAIRPTPSAEAMMTRKRPPERIAAALLALATLCAPLGLARAAAITGTGDPLAHPLLAGGTQIGFESIAADSLHASLTFPGVVITGQGGDLFVLDDFAGSFNTTGNSVALRTSTPVQAATFAFTAPVTAFGLNIGATDRAWQLRAFDAGDALLGTLDIPVDPADNSGSWFGLAFAGIASARLVNVGYEASPGTATQDFILFDKLSFASAVPEPGSLALIAIGLAMLRRRRSANEEH